MSLISKYDYIDSLRGLAIIAVVLCHISIEFHDIIPFQTLSIFMFMGGCGVQLFYVMSAFTLFYSFSNRIDNETNPVYYFFIRRFFRIAPLFYLAIIFYSLFINERFDIKITLLMFSFLHGFSIEHINSVFMGSWSIAVEFLFYCTIPFLFVKIKNLDAAIKFLLLAIVVAFILQATLKRIPFLQLSDTTPFLYFYFPSQLPVFSLGIVLFFLIIKNEYSIKPSTLLLISLTFIIHFVLGGKGILPAHLQVSFGFSLLAFTLSKKPYTLLVNKFTKFVGKLSYSIYLFHMAIILSIKKYATIYNLPFMNNILVVCFTVGILCILFSYATYKTIELPFIDLGSKIIKNRESKSLAKI